MDSRFVLGSEEGESTDKVGPFEDDVDTDEDAPLDGATEASAFRFL